MTKKPPTEWTLEQKALIDWFLAEKHLPRGPYALRSGTTVINDFVFYERLKAEIAGGPSSPRAMLGGLFDDLECLKEVCRNWVWP